VLAVNLAFEIVGQLGAVMQDDGHLQFSLPSGGTGRLIPTRHTEGESTRMIIKKKHPQKIPLKLLSYL